MVWYYKVGEQEMGPVSKTELQALIKSNEINGQSLVKSVEMDDWCPLIDVIRGKTPKPQSPPPPSENASAGSDIGQPAVEEVPVRPMQAPPLTDVQADGGTPADAGADSRSMCSQCGGFFPEDQVLAYNDQLVCAGCKPKFVQKLKEGAAISSNIIYAGFWPRLGAKFIDNLILGFFIMVIYFGGFFALTAMFGPAMAAESNSSDGAAVFYVIGLFCIMFFAAFIIPMIYASYMVGRWGATVGKMALKLVVVTPDGKAVTYKRAIGRYFAEVLNYFTFYIGFIIAAFDDEGRTLHDHMCSTRVIVKTDL